MHVETISSARQPYLIMTNLQGFEKAMNALGPPARTAPDLPAKLPPMDPSSKGIADKDTDVPSVSDLGYIEAGRTPFKVLLGSTYGLLYSCDPMARFPMLGVRV